MPVIMRIDKFLWSTRYFKTRNIATNACKKGHVKINGITAKPGREVFPMDEIVARKNQIDYKFTVLDIPPSRVGAKLVDIYRKDTTPKEAFEHNELLQYSKDYYRKKGIGRPTKKDRRDIDEFLDTPTNDNKEENSPTENSSKEIDD
ncbi:Heat shock protein Hsp15 [Maribacter litoralis]|uniref:Heat shock protein Hsp15 n=2 Tax=Maribacter litoralis TaxID=2059726 RepID=A0A653UVN3_9FLAO|nr:Heat shock protein Hsp15 [Maribacter litoralis]